MAVMKISLIQTPLSWEDPRTNRENFTEKINSIEETDLILLPEMFATGFTMQPEKVAETMEGKSVTWMRETAQAKNCAIVGSLVIHEHGDYFNRLVFAFPDGHYKTYDKRHLFSLAGEEKHYTAGSDRLIVDYRGWKICPLVCYDLRFPVFSRNTEDFDLLLYVANWPQKRAQAWDVLLRARAVENMCYVAGLNRIGQDSNGHNYSGHSQVVDSLGDYLLEPFSYEDAITVTLDKAHLEEVRNKLGFLNDRDSFTLL